MKRFSVKFISVFIVVLIVITTMSIGFTSMAAAVDYANNIPEENYVHHIITKREVDLFGYKSNTTDERFFTWGEYQWGFKEFIMNPYDITKADYIEFDIFTDIPTDLSISVGSESTTKNPQWNNYFEFYDIRTLRKTITLKDGWNHICIEVDDNFYTQDPATKNAGTYNKNAVDGLVLHDPKSNYIRLTNFALTSKTPTQYVPPLKDTNDEEVKEEIFEGDSQMEETFKKLQEVFNLLIKLIFVLEQNKYKSADFNSDGTVDMVDIIIVKNQMLAIVMVD